VEHPLPPSRGTAPALQAVELTKRYPLFFRRRDRALAFLGATRRLAYKTALDRVSLAAAAGEAVGIIGENGSGKTTLLRLVAGISRPDGGSMSVTQPVSAILELGLGFHSEFTGRENALLYGSVVGIPEGMMRERLAEVLAFADLGEYVDQPVRTYSSGMIARLAFAVATHVEPAVLVVDEALAVGDGAFQKKCVARMVRFKEEARTVLFCSHSMYLVASFCEKVAWLRNGRLEDVGEPNQVIPGYERYLRRRVLESAHPADAAGRTMARVEGLTLRDAGGSPVAVLTPGADYTLEAVVETLEPGEAIHLGVAVDDAGGECLAGFTTLIDGFPPLSGHRRWRVRVHLPQQPFSRGQLEVALFVLDATGLVPYAHSRLGPVPVDNAHPSPGPITPAHSWEWNADDA
jgi:ABC-type polysaccharide/polyol phosphate transport system ATPase subunit